MPLNRRLVDFDDDVDVLHGVLAAVMLLLPGACATLSRSLQICCGTMDIVTLLLLTR
jgi:hypothetical protein